MRIFYIILIAICTPWFWTFSFPNNLLQTNFTKEVEQARILVDYQRGKSSTFFLNEVFINWPMQVLGDRMQTVFENLDIGNYLFAGHPRERVGVVEAQKFFFFQFILFILGFTNPEIKKHAKYLIIYTFGVFTFIFIFKWRDFNQTILLSLPLIFIMVLGLEKLIYFKKWLVLLFVFAVAEIIS